MVLYSELSSTVDSAIDVPVVDVAALREGKEDEIRKLLVAAKEWGFLRVANHGVPPELLREMGEQAHQIFALPDEVKEKNATPAGGFNGYYRAEQSIHPSRWGEGLRLPLQPQQMNEILTKLCLQNNETSSRVLKEYIAAVDMILVDLLKHLALSLGLDSTEFTRDVRSDGHASTLPLKFYPAASTSEPPKPTLYVASHTDPQILTILYENNVEGLQILKNEQWIAIKPRPECFNVLVGDTLQVMSNDIYRSCTHKVVVTGEAFRFIVLYALAPAGKAIVKPAPQLVTTKMPSQYRPFTSDEYYVSLRESKVHGQLHLDKFRSVKAQPLGF